MARTNLTHNTVSVGAAATELVDGTTSRGGVLIQNVHATQVLYIGGSAVTTANGFRLNSGESVALDYVGPVFGIASGAATDIRVVETF